MALDGALLEEARLARGRLARLHHEANQVEAAYHDALRALHAAGASLREIAYAERLSHQRVHQIVQSLPISACCSFCNTTKDAAATCVRGPGVVICGACVRLGAEVVACRADRSDGRITLLPLHGDPRARCSFCRKRRRQVDAVVAGGGGHPRICSDCLALCEEILVEELGR